MRGVTRALWGAAMVLAIGAAVPAAAMAAVKFTRVGSIPGTGGAAYAFVRTADGTLHIVRPTSDNGAQGLSEDSISPSGAIQSPVTALSTALGDVGAGAAHAAQRVAGGVLRCRRAGHERRQPVGHHVP
ncbi:MAG TPA: hypothetical protein VHW96_04970 [Solirubrobacteraceae bacterium]|nr:hypothetical protein [Solirubrobacteraceae bacterium]